MFDACVPKASMCTPDVCNRIKKNLALKRNTFPPRMPCQTDYAPRISVLLTILTFAIAR